MLCASISYSKCQLNYIICLVLLNFVDRNGANLIIIVENVVHAFSDFVGQTKQQVFGSIYPQSLKFW